MAGFDQIVLTAANAAQARGYRRQIAWRRTHGLLDPRTAVHVLPDPGGRRVGSLGATLHAFRFLARRFAREAGRTHDRSLDALFRGRRILVCHSGGDSRRTPAYAAQGKVFVPLPAPPRNGLSPALFDLILDNLERLPAPPGGHVLIAVGDVLLTFDPAAGDFRAAGVTGVAYAGPLARGSRHGVYVAEAPASGSGPRRVRDFLQKPDESMARTHRAMDGVGRVLIDTGLLSFDPPAAARLLAAGGVRRRGPRLTAGPGLLRDLETGRLDGADLYEELSMALAPAVDPASYGARMAARHGGARGARRLAAFYQAMRGLPFWVNVLPACEFFHVGSSRDLLANLSPLTRTAEAYGFTNFQGCRIAPGASLEGSFAYNSIVSVSDVRASGSLLEAVHADVRVELPGRNILVGLPAGGRTPLRLPEDVGLVCLPIGAGQWAAVVHGLDDDFKTDSRGEAGCLFLNRPIGEWLERHDLSPSVLWPAGGARQDLWEARLWMAGDLPAVLEAALWMASGRPEPAPAAWRRSRRYSLAQLLRRVNHDRLLAHRGEILRAVGLGDLARRLLADDRLSAAAVSAEIRSRGEADRAAGALAQAIGERDDALFRARVLRVAEVVTREHRVSRRALAGLGAGSAPALRRAAFRAVADAVAMAAEIPHEPRPAALLHDQVVWVTTPVRLDFSGGWSDTPPISTELGGAVVNAAITLNGQYPVQVMAKRNGEGVIRLSSIDLGQRVTLRCTREALDCADPRHWAALPKAALVLSGIVPEDPAIPLRRWLDVLGGGLDLTVFSAVPKGSGLGTSSILGAAVLACLGRVRGTPPSVERLTALTSILEQRMNTGGGWQDQVGGIVPGVKLIRTQPGVAQAISLSWAALDLAPGGGARERLLLYFTGRQRMARDILHNIVSRYLARDPLTLRTIAELKAGALEMKAGLDARDLDAFARGVERYWELKKRIDPGATNAAIEALLRRVAHWTSGRVLPGAGGGGFVLFVARDAEAAREIRRRLTARPAHPAARFFDFDVDQAGLKVTVL
jgi:fucokinase